MNPVNNCAMPLRSRSVWEAADSGVLLWRGSFIYFIPFFAIPVWTAACSLRLLSGKLFFIPYIGLWWLKPLFDRLALHVISKRFFDFPASSKLKDLCHGIAEMRRGLLGDLLWRRFSPSRAVNLPVKVLEHLGAKQFSLRKKNLEIGGISFCPFISILGLALEAALLLGEILFALMAASLVFPAAIDYLQENGRITEIFIFAAFCLNYILVESLYVCMGFGLYINSRVEAEGWDMELLFKKFAGRRIAARQSPERPFKFETKIVLLICLFAVLPVSAYAKDAAEYPAVPEQAILDLQEILSSPDFGGERESWAIHLKNRDYEELPGLDFGAGLEKVRSFFGFLLRFFVFLFILSFAFFVFYWFIKNHRQLFREKLFTKKSSGSIRNSRNEVSREKTELLFARAEDFFNSGNLREAWAACFSGCLGAYSLFCSIAFPADSTEYDCLRLVREAAGSSERAFGEIVQNWICFAYGTRPPGKEAFEKALAHGRSLLEAK